MNHCDLTGLRSEKLKELFQIKYLKVLRKLKLQIQAGRWLEEKSEEQEDYRLR